MSNVDLLRKRAQIMRGGGHLANEAAEYKLLEPRLRTLNIKYR